MGIDVYGFLIVGVPISREDCFVAEKNRWMCDKGHIRERDGAQFCESDGTRFVRKPIERATPWFAAWAKEAGYEEEPSGWWDNLRDTYYESDVGIFCVDSVYGGIQKSNLALGYRIAVVGSHRESVTKTTGFAIEYLSGKAGEIESLAKRLGLPDRKAQVFLSMSVS